MDDKLLTEILTSLLKTQREQRDEIDRLSRIVTVLRVGATPAQEQQIEEFVRRRTAQALGSLPTGDETSQTLDEKLRELDAWADKKT